MKTKFLYGIAVLGAAFAIRSKFVWEGCGGDCGIIRAEGPFVAIGGWYFGLAVTFLAVFLIVMKTTKNKSEK